MPEQANKQYGNVPAALVQVVQLMLALWLGLAWLGPVQPAVVLWYHQPLGTPAAWLGQRRVCPCVANVAALWAASSSPMCLYTVCRDVEAEVVIRRLHSVKPEDGLPRQLPPIWGLVPAPELLWLRRRFSGCSRLMQSHHVCVITEVWMHQDGVSCFAEGTHAAEKGMSWTASC